MRDQQRPASSCRIWRPYWGRLKTGLSGLILILVVAVGCSDGRPPVDLDADIRAIDERLVVGDYRNAELLAAAARDRAALTHGTDSLELAQIEDLLVKALVKNGKGGTPATLSIAEHVGAIKESSLGPEDLRTATTLHALGSVRLARGEFNRALDLHMRALSIHRATPPDERALADSLEQVAFALIRLKRFEAAAKTLAEALRIRETDVRDAPLALAQTLEYVALMYRRSGRFADALPPVERSLALRRKFAPGHPDTASPLQILGDLRFLAGDIDDAKRIWNEARDIAERGLGSDHVAVAELLNRLGLAEESGGNLAQARSLRQQALRIGERWLAPCHPQSAILVNDLAASFEAEGQYVEARRLYRKAAAALDDCARTIGVSPEPDTRATTALNEAKLATRMGDWDEAERLYRTSIDMWSKTLGTDHPFVARGLEGLADVASSQGRFNDSRRLYEQVLGMRRKSLGSAHPQVGWTLASLAEVSRKAGTTAAALRFVDESVAVFERSGAGDEPDRFPQALELRGLLRAGIGRVRAGRGDLERALAERSRIFGPTHPLVATSRLAIAEVDFANGSADLAFASAIEAEQEGRAHLRLTARHLPERVALAYASRRPRGLDLALSAADAAPERRMVVLDEVIRSRGLILDELAARSHTLRRTGPQSSATAQRAQQARQRFANLLVRSLDEPVARAMMDEARREKEDAERALAEESASERAELARASVGLADVRRALPPGTTVVSFVQYNRSARLPEGGSMRETPSMAAFVLSAGQPVPTLLNIGAMADLERLISAFRAEASGRSLRGRDPGAAMRDYDRAGESLRRLIWDPVAPHVRDAERLLVIPDGAIGLVPLAALPTGEGSYLIERWPPISYLSAERDLVTLTLPAPTSARGMLALGGPAFGDWDSAAVAPVHAIPMVARRSATDCTSAQGLRFRPLAGTVAEVEEISRLWTARRSAEPARLLLGTQASETAFKQAAHAYRVLHLATHGFFLGDTCPPAAVAETRGVGGLAVGSRRSGDNPLRLSGLALSGANSRSSDVRDVDDGILTAEEVAGLDLGGVEWAVLSACDTGVGEVSAGEGVFGLRRAFQIAGARSVIMSLWSVEDQSTRAWMRALYEERFQRNRPTADAVHQASLTLLRARRSQGLPTHPFHWAAFVAAGDWR